MFSCSDCFKEIVENIQGKRKYNMFGGYASTVSGPEV